MIWRTLIRDMEKRPGLPMVEGPARFGVPVEAPDRDAARAQLPEDTKQTHYAVVADCSWRLMTTRERTDLMAGHPPAEIRYNTIHPSQHRLNAYREEPSNA